MTTTSRPRHPSSDKQHGEAMVSSDPHLKQVDEDRIDVEAAHAALAESNERIPYEQVRRELGLTE